VGFNLFFPCPAVNGFDEYETSHAKHTPHIVDVVQQKQVDGDLWTILRCPWCGCLCRVPPAAGFVLADEVATEQCYYTKMFWAGMAHRIRDGYEISLADIN